MHETLLKPTRSSSSRLQPKGHPPWNRFGACFKARKGSSKRIAARFCRKRIPEVVETHAYYECSATPAPQRYRAKERLPNQCFMQPFGAALRGNHGRREHAQNLQNCSGFRSAGKERPRIACPGSTIIHVTFWHFRVPFPHEPAQNPFGASV